MERGVNVEISPNVIMSIASRSALEVKGVYSLEIPANVSFWRKSQQHGVKVNIVDNNKVRLEVYVIAEEGYYLPEVGLNLQEHIKEEIERVTGMTVDRIDIYIQGIHFSKSEETER
ncbi:Asp23/Gls24 family envelope stress response protein [bacterium]|nr:Asp23/Gls24 family envelope stress response protein [bacterium]